MGATLAPGRIAVSILSLSIAVCGESSGRFGIEAEHKSGWRSLKEKESGLEKTTSEKQAMNEADANPADDER